MFQSPVFWILLFGSSIIFWHLPVGLRYWFLGVVSVGYAAVLEPLGTVILLSWVIVFFYLAPRALGEAREASFVLLGLVGGVLGFLFWFKYLPSIAEFLAGASPGLAIAIPLGISYYTFKLIHYVVEMVRGNIKDRSFSRFLCYIFLFPIFTAGPIQRYDHFLANAATRWDNAFFVDGMTRIIFGLIKVFVVLTVLVKLYPMFGLPLSGLGLVERLNEFSTAEIWLFLSLTYLYAYLDFSAYSDIAIGASRLFGLKIMENFNWPILAINIQDFWRRWHMTLAAWCQSYIYLPVMARLRSPYAAIFATFVSMGVWHGASAGWVLWGVYHAVGVSAYVTWARYARRFDWWRKAQKSPLRFIGLPATFAFVSGSYAFSSTGGTFTNSLTVFLAIFGVRFG
ncbi:MAG: hypothetical protein KJO42_01725 [Silicimonas sp.]|nr:hypothetical protein [Silicimonas sp.]